jgi:DNA-binding winged helix-turn-helix (wHTH) protein
MEVVEAANNNPRELQTIMYTLPSGRVRFGAFELDLSTGELRSIEASDPNNKVLLREQVFQVLRMLLEHEGKIVTREEIKSGLWANDTVVDFDHSINATIKTLRRALGDSADDPRYIETLARRGYRLMLPIQYLESAPETTLEKDREQHEQSVAEISENVARVQEDFQPPKSRTGGTLRSCSHLLSFWSARAIFLGGTFGLRNRRGPTRSCSPYCHLRISPAIPIRNISRTV